MATFGEWEYSCDVEGTERAYAQAGRSGAELCGCETCLNYLAVRDQLLPHRFLAFLKSLGINQDKEAEAYYIGADAPGRHHYGGWFHFVGELHKTGDFPMVELAPGFKTWLCRAHAPSLKALDGLPLVQIEFVAENVPWLIAELEPT